MDLVRIGKIKEGDNDYLKLGTEIKFASHEDGLIVPLKDQQIDKLADYVIGYFRWLALGNITEALKLKKAGEFVQWLKQEKESHYQNFDIGYLSNILRAYKKWKDHNNIPQNKKPDYSLKALPMENKKDKNQKGREYWEFFQDYIKKGEFPTGGRWVLALNWGYKNGKIKITSDQLEKHRQQVRIDIDREITMLDPRETLQLQTKRTTLKSPELFRLECQDRYMRKYVKDQIEARK